MVNYNGLFEDIIVRKLQDLVISTQQRVNKESRSALLIQLLLLSENPAFDAAMIVALKSANVLEKIREEIANPSFSIGDYSDKVNNAPSAFCKNYQLSDEFVSSEIVETQHTSPVEFQDVVRLKYGKDVVAKIVVMPSFVDTGPAS